MRGVPTQRVGLKEPLEPKYSMENPSSMVGVIHEC